MNLLRIVISITKPKSNQTSMLIILCMLPLNSLASGKFEWNFRHVIFKQILVIDGGGISCEIALIWMSLDFTDDQSLLVQVMAWCRQATSHYLSQCWPRSLTLYGVTRPLWVTPSSLKSKHFHYDELFITGCTGSYRNDKWVNGMLLNGTVWMHYVLECAKCACVQNVAVRSFKFHYPLKTPGL